MSFTSDVSELVFKTSGSNKVIQDIQAQQHAFEKMESTVGKMGKSGGGVQSMMDMFSGSANPVDLAVKGLQMEVSLIQQAVQEYTKYGNSVRELMELQGMSQQEAAAAINLSRIAGVTDQAAVREQIQLVKDLSTAQGRMRLQQIGVNVRPGETGMQIFSDVQKHIDALPAGIQRSTAAMTVFKGRSLETYYALSRVSESGRALAEKYSDTFNTGAIERIQEFTEATNGLGVAFMSGIVYPLAQDVLPMLTKLASGVTWVIGIFDSFNKATGGAALKVITFFTGVIGFAVEAANALLFLIHTLEKIPGAKKVEGWLSGDKDSGDNKAADEAGDRVKAIQRQFQSASGGGYNGYSGGGSAEGGSSGGGSDSRFQDSAGRFGDAVDRFVNVMSDAKSLQQLAPGQVPSRLTEADLAMLTMQRVQGAVG